MSVQPINPYNCGKLNIKVAGWCLTVTLKFNCNSCNSKVFEHLVVVCLGRHCGVLPTTQFAYRKGLGTCDALLCVSHKLQSALESGQEARIVQIDFSAAFDRVNHQGILIGSALWVSVVL